MNVDHLSYYLYFPFVLRSEDKHINLKTQIQHMGINRSLKTNKMLYQEVFVNYFILWFSLKKKKIQYFILFSNILIHLYHKNYFFSFSFHQTNKKGFSHYVISDVRGHFFPTKKSIRKNKFKHLGSNS